jgi:hypothetical protein
MVEEGVAGEEDTLKYLLSRARRTSLPLRHAFVHDTRPGGGPGPLSWFLRRPDTLDLFLLMLAVAVRGPHNLLFPHAVWSRALGRPGPSGELWVSKSINWLEAHSLVSRTRKGRLVEIYMLSDAGTGAEYSRPTGGRKKPQEWFFRLPHAYFLEGWHKRLSAAGKAVLLIAHASPPEFTLPLRQGSQWYGVSVETLARGLDELKEGKILAFRTTRKKAPQLRLGYTLEPHYSLKEPFKKGTRPRAAS